MLEADDRPWRGSPRPAIVCRQMTPADIDAAIALLAHGFPERNEAYWRRGLARLAERGVPEPYPRFGYVMTDAGRLVGIVLLIFSRTHDERILGNVSSWYVKPDYRGFSSALLAFVFRLKNVVLFNISPTPSTIATIEAQGFKRYCEGTYHALPVLGRGVRGARIHAIVPDGGADATRLAHLAHYGCKSYEILLGGRVYPFAFLPRRFSQDRLPGAQLVYCTDLADFVRFAGPLGRRLLRHGLYSVMLNANGPIPGLPGRFLPGRRTKFFRGEAPPPLNDLSETELVLFGP